MSGPGGGSGMGGSGMGGTGDGSGMGGSGMGGTGDGSGMGGSGMGGTGDGDGDGLGFLDGGETLTGDEPRRSRKDADPADATRQSRTWSPYDEGSRSRGPIWFAIGGVLVLGLLGGGLAVMWNAGGSETVASRPTRTSAPLPTVPGGEFGFAEARTTDPDPITVKEIFGSKKKITYDGRSYEMTITSKDKKCTDGALGDRLQKALKSAKCTQLVRASFRDKPGKVIGTIGVANLKSSATARKVAKSGDTKNYVKPLAGKDTVTKYLGSGSGGAKIWTHGHYAIMVWFQNKDGSKPDSKASKLLTQAIKDLTKATVFKALDHRSLTGNPA
uniref:hypothetical protein n=1 Tax=Nonomuraea pusilla TaxID=46177 RepID=UPI000AF4750A|nr:hypothetical protein [Nonomuraea pusilla]